MIPLILWLTLASSPDTSFCPNCYTILPFDHWAPQVEDWTDLPNYSIPSPQSQWDVIVPLNQI